MAEVVVNDRNCVFLKYRKIINSYFIKGVLFFVVVGLVSCGSRPKAVIISFDSLELNKDILPHAENILRDNIHRDINREKKE